MSGEYREKQKRGKKVTATTKQERYDSWIDMMHKDKDKVALCDHHHKRYCTLFVCSLSYYAIGSEIFARHGTTCTMSHISLLFRFGTFFSPLLSLSPIHCMYNKTFVCVCQDSCRPLRKTHLLLTNTSNTRQTSNNRTYGVDQRGGKAKRGRSR